MNECDSKIISMIQSRDEHGIQLLLQRYGGLIKSICRKNLYYLDSHLDECINDCLFGIWNNIDKFDENKNTFKNWVCVIAKYQSIDMLRKHQKDTETSTLEDNIVYLDKGLKLHEQAWFDLIKDLSEVDQQILTMIYLEGYRPEEVAAMLGQRTSNIYNRTSRAKDKLRFAKEELR
ncbi:sigma-70 family RNA polymerase sigma factor [Macrococcoides bohemicum]|uniref:sigma-70 family RNA polymerase sigma factor n=1 Tax=Macrococcoides bohemicum TaxID=1903056 RepID=UPI00165E909E|nr:sigma-70 family RNA polymerase sigma factor [Macrococcus bohemicus]MBC9874506.1 sigma-70 family RNA polymerase sigma factor [Macrococcus bohemicus]QYA45126.1 sigma-70 family RNA polymerase sigma factor [Macrococcus bohemicus]